MEAGTHSNNRISLLLSETLGTAIFISCIFYTALYQTNPIAIALGVGGGLFIAMTIFGKETGGHFNPAVSIAYYLFIAENKLEKSVNFVILLIAQVLGGFLAGLILYFTANKNEPLLKPDEENFIGSFMDEIFFTFLFISVIFCVKSSVLSQTKDNTLKSLTVAFTLMLCVLFGGQISGACYNPAVGISVNFWASIAEKDKKYIKYMSYYIMAPIIGGLLAGFFNRFFLGLPFEVKGENNGKADGEENFLLMNQEEKV